METTDEMDAHPQNHTDWIEKYREVKPLILEPPLINNQLKSIRAEEISSGLEPYTGEWNKRQVRHLLSRTLFGIKKTELDYFTSIPMETAVNEIVSASPIPASPVNDYEGINENAVDPHVALGETWIEAPHGSSKEGLRIVSLKTWFIKNMIQQEATIQEKMVLFWSNLLVTKVWDVYMAKASYQYYKLLYENALGNYKELIKLITTDPSMLKFLNGRSNTKNAPDENYARELQELFCVGKGADSQYTEDDVQEAARVLTGWRIDWTAYENDGQFTSYFDPSKHDNEDKQFSSFYNNNLIEGKTGEEGKNELDDLLDMIFDNEETSKYICRRIYSFYIYNEITDLTEQNIITPLAEIFRNNNFEIKPVLLALLKSEHFYDQLNCGVLIKSPADHLLGLMRTFEITTPVDGDLVRDYEKHRALLWNMSGIGMEIGDPPNVAGWTPYYQAPQFDKAWITTTTITKRASQTDALVKWGLWVSSQRRLYTDLTGFVSNLDDPSDPNLLLQEALLIFLGLDASEKVINDLKSVLLSGQENDNYWTSAWNSFVADPENETKKTTVENRLKQTFQKILQLGEYHLL